MDVNLPSGATATLREVADLTAGDKLAVQSAITIDTAGGNMQISLGLAEEMKIATVAHVVSAWSFEAPPSVISVQTLSLADYAALCDAAQPHMAALGMGADKS
jgi:hypothetical protein